MSFENTFTNEEIYAIGKHLVENGEWRRFTNDEGDSYALLAIRLPYGADLSSTGSRVDSLNRIVEQRLEAGCTCQSCGTKYTVDLIVEDDIWEQVKPDRIDVGAGLLCSNCILEAIAELKGYCRFDLIKSTLVGIE